MGAGNVGGLVMMETLEDVMDMSAGSRCSDSASLQESHQEMLLNIV